MTNYTSSSDIIKMNKKNLDSIAGLNSDINETAASINEEEGFQNHSNSTRNQISSVSSGMSSSISTTSNLINSIATAFQQLRGNITSIEARSSMNKMLSTTLITLIQINSVLTAFRADYILSKNGKEIKGNGFYDISAITQPLNNIAVTDNSCKTVLNNLNKYANYANRTSNSFRQLVGNENLDEDQNEAIAGILNIANTIKGFAGYGSLIPENTDNETLKKIRNGSDKLRNADTSTVSSLVGSFMTDQQKAELIDPLNQMANDYKNSNDPLLQKIGGFLNQAGFKQETKTRETDSNLVMSALAPFADDIRDMIEDKIEATHATPTEIPIYSKPVWIVNSMDQTNYIQNPSNTRHEELFNKRLQEVMEGRNTNNKDIYGNELLTSKVHTGVDNEGNFYSYNSYDGKLFNEFKENQKKKGILDLKDIKSNFEKKQSEANEAVYNRNHKESIWIDENGVERSNKNSEVTKSIKELGKVQNTGYLQNLAMINPKDGASSQNIMTIANIVIQFTDKNSQTNANGFIQKSINLGKVIRNEYFPTTENNNNPVQNDSIKNTNNSNKNNNNSNKNNSVKSNNNNNLNRPTTLTNDLDKTTSIMSNISNMLKTEFNLKLITNQLIYKLGLKQEANINELTTSNLKLGEPIANSNGGLPFSKSFNDIIEKNKKKLALPNKESITTSQYINKTTNKEESREVVKDKIENVGSKAIGAITIAGIVALIFKYLLDNDKIPFLKYLLNNNSDNKNEEVIENNTETILKEKSLSDYLNKTQLSLARKSLNNDFAKFILSNPKSGNLLFFLNGGMDILNIGNKINQTKEFTDFKNNDNYENTIFNKKSKYMYSRINKKDFIGDDIGNGKYNENVDIARAQYDQNMNNAKIFNEMMKKKGFSTLEDSNGNPLFVTTLVKKAQDNALKRNYRSDNIFNNADWSKLVDDGGQSLHSVTHSNDWDVRQQAFTNNTTHYHIGTGKGLSNSDKVESSSKSIDNDFIEASNYVINKGYKELDGGTYPQFFSDYLGKSNISVSNVNSLKDIKNNLSNGNPVILMGQDVNDNGSTPFGKEPHYVVATGFDGKNIKIVDSESKNSYDIYNADKVLNKTSIRLSTNNTKSDIINKSSAKGKKPKFGKGQYYDGKDIAYELSKTGDLYVSLQGYVDAYELFSEYKKGNSIWDETEQKLPSITKKASNSKVANYSEKTNSVSPNNNSSNIPSYSSNSSSPSSSSPSSSNSSSSSSSPSNNSSVSPSKNIAANQNIYENNGSLYVVNNIEFGVKLDIEDILDEFKELNEIQDDSLDVLNIIYKKLLKRSGKKANSNLR